MAFKLAEAYVQISQRGLTGVQNRIRGITSVLFRALRPAALLSATIGTLGFGIGARSMLKLAGNVEALTISFEVLLGSQQAALKMMEDINEFAARTPFEQLALADVTKQLLAFGVAQEDVIPTLTKLGDIAALSGARLADLARIFGRAKGTGVLLTETLDMFLERGIPIGRELSKVLELRGIADGQANLRDLIPTGIVTFDILQEAIDNLTTGTGQFAGGMERLSQTMPGLFSTFTGNLKVTLAQIGTGIIKAFDLKEITRRLGVWMSTVWERFGDRITATLTMVGEKFNEFRQMIGSSIPTVREFFQTGIAGASGLLKRVVALTKAVHDLIGGFKLAAIVIGALALAHPWTAAIIGTIAFLGWLDRVNDRLAENQQLMSARARQDERQRATDDQAAERLQTLADKHKLNNTEMEEAEGIVADLTTRYGDLGIRINETTGTIEGMTEALAKQNQAQQQQRIRALEAEIRDTEKTTRDAKIRLFFTGGGVGGLKDAADRQKEQRERRENLEQELEAVRGGRRSLEPEPAKPTRTVKQETEIDRTREALRRERATLSVISSPERQKPIIERIAVLEAKLAELTAVLVEAAEVPEKTRMSIIESLQRAGLSGIGFTAKTIAAANVVSGPGQPTPEQTQFQFTSLAGLADQMQLEAGRRLQEETARNTGDAVQVLEAVDTKLQRFIEGLVRNDPMRPLQPANVWG